MSSMKGLLKGLRYISQIFENEKEEEMQIGFPTDVKHVAHIGMDGSSSTKPSWMNEFTPNENASANEASSKPPTKPSADPVLTRDISEVQMLTGPSDSPSRQSKPKQSRRHHSSSSPVGSPSRDPEKHRKHKTSGDLGSPAREPGGTRTRRIPNSNLGSESPAQDKPSVPKSRRKKSRENIGSVASNRSSKSKGSDGIGETTFHSDPGSGGRGYGMNNNNNNPVLKVYDEGNECDDNSRGIRTM